MADNQDHAIVAESRARLLDAMILMDEGRFEESIEKCISSSRLSIEAMLVSWKLASSGSSCFEMLTSVGQRSPVALTSRIRHCCRKIDLHSSFYRGLDGGPRKPSFDEEYTMELINYGRDLLRFARSNLSRAEVPDSQ